MHKHYIVRPIQPGQRVEGISVGTNSGAIYLSPGDTTALADLLDGMDALQIQFLISALRYALTGGNSAYSGVQEEEAAA